MFGAPGGQKWAQICKHSTFSSAALMAVQGGIPANLWFFLRS